MYTLNREKKYELGLITLLLLFISVFGFFFFHIINNYLNSQIFIPQNNKKIVYMLKSMDTIKYLKDREFNIENYYSRLDLIKKYLSTDYKIEMVTEEDIKSLKDDSVLLAFDLFNLSSSSKDDILNFLKRGGKLIFNYHFGYFIDEKYEGEKLLNEITSLKLVTEAERKTDLFITPNLISPISYNFDKVKRYDYILYDKIPVLKSSKTPDAVMSNWRSTSTPIIEDRLLPFDESGVMWHGNYNKGSWVYFSFPSYTLTDASLDMFDYYLKGSIRFLSSPITIIKFPYISYDKVVFISEDTEYQYKNLKRFSELSKKYRFNTTAFCVGSLAKKYPEITKEASENPYIEIGSHSYSHKKIIGTDYKNMLKETLGSKLILEKITGKKVFGFRPPREEIDENLSKALIESKYIYTMEKLKGFFYPKEEYKGLITIPRHGADDYEYIIELDWDKERILNEIIKQSDFLTNLNLLYTLSVHTHMLTYGKNIEILEKYFKYLSKRGDIKVLNGKDIALFSKYQRNIHLDYEKSINKIFIKIENSNSVAISNFTFRVYYNNLENIYNFASEIFGIDVKEVKRGDKYVDIRVSKLKPKSTLIIFANYK